MTSDATSTGASSPLDLVLTRVIDVPRDLVWKAWTNPEHIKKWFAPRPWQTVACDIDLRPGGRFNTTMRGPDGTEIPGQGIVLAVEPGRRLVFSDTLTEGWRPASEPFFTAIVTMEEEGKGKTRYTAHALHKNEEDKLKHEKMGFYDGWGTVIDQLAEVARSLA